MALIPPVFIDCVVAIGSEAEPGKRHWAASGFLYGRKVGTQHHVFVVTNRHVVEGLDRGFFRFNPQGDAPALEYPFSALNARSQEWFFHPRKEVDVAVFPISVVLANMDLQLQFFQREPHVADVARMKVIGVREGDQVYALGFPLALVGKHRNAVVARMGCVAQIRDALAGRSDLFLIDAGIFPGNSGGPVLLKPEALFVPDTQAQQASFLIGIVQSYVPYQDVAVSQQTKRPRIIFEENSGLGAVHTVDCIEETIDECYRHLAAAAGSSAPGSPGPISAPPESTV
jgi:hypothetical protein